MKTFPHLSIDSFSSKQKEEVKVMLSCPLIRYHIMKQLIRAEV
jgi:hypothetical protein